MTHVSGFYALPIGEMIEWAKNVWIYRSAVHYQKMANCLHQSWEKYALLKILRFCIDIIVEWRVEEERIFITFSTLGLNLGCSVNVSGNYSDSVSCIVIRQELNIIRVACSATANFCIVNISAISHQIELHSDPSAFHAAALQNL